MRPIGRLEHNSHYFVRYSDAIRLCVGAVLAAGLLLAAASAHAVPVTLTDGNSTVLIDPNSNAGVYSWTLTPAGASQLDQQQFWFRTNLASWSSREYSLNEIGTATVSQSVPNMAKVTWTAAKFRVEVTYVLVGGTNGKSSDLAEVIKITNTSSKAITFDLFQYADFNLGGTTADRSVRIDSTKAADQVDIGYGYVKSSETVVSGDPNLYQVGLATTILGKLTDGDVDNLSGLADWTTTGDLGWAFQWSNRVIEPDDALLISENNVVYPIPGVIPEPAGLGLVGVALLALKRRRS